MNTIVGRVAAEAGWVVPGDSFCAGACEHAVAKLRSARAARANARFRNFIVSPSSFRGTISERYFFITRWIVALKLAQSRTSETSKYS
jgi:hypothetical protein